MPVQLAPEPTYRQTPGNPAGGASSRPFYSFNAGQVWAPSVNLYETERAYVACVDLAGVEKDKIDVELDEMVLTIKGHRAVPTDFDPDCLGPAEAGGTASGGAGGAGGGRRCKVHVMEIDHGPFSRTVELPTDADKDAITARYRDGLLWIDVPKKGGDA